MTVPGIRIAIDGPSSVGKGTVARTIATRLGYRHVDTGAMYRAVAWKARNLGLDLTDETAITALATRAAIDLDRGVVIDGRDVSREIRTPAMDEASTIVAQYPGVRAALVLRQRALGAAGAVVMEGRDIGSVVLPHAEVKIYLDASPDERARRRSRDQAHSASGEDGVARVAAALEARDRLDRTRAASPLRIAEDAVYIDTTTLEVEGVVARVLTLVERVLTGGAGLRAGS